jgi:hypothetical protein
MKTSKNNEKRTYAQGFVKCVKNINILIKNVFFMFLKSYFGVFRHLKF